MENLFWIVQATHELRKHRGGYVEAATLFEGAKNSLQLLKSFNPVLLGGFALSYYAEPRATQDFDLTILADIKSVEKILFKNRFTKDTETTFKGVCIYHYKRDNFKLDILTFDNEEFQKDIISRAQQQTFLGESLLIISPEDLVVTKLLAFRNKDKLDIISILESNLDLDFLKIKSAAQKLKIFDRYAFVEENLK